MNIRHGDYKTPTRRPRTKKAMREFLLEHPRYDTMGDWNNATSYARNVKLTHIDIPEECKETAWEILNVDHWGHITQFNDPLDIFQMSHNDSWQWGTNGRSGGYIMLYQGGREPSGYRSYCQACGQRNYTAVLLLPENPTPRDLLVKYVIEHNHWRPDIYHTQPEVQALGLPNEEVLAVVAETRNKYQDDKHHMWVTFNNECGVCRQPERVNYEKMPYRTFTTPGQGVDQGEDFAEWDMDYLRSRVDLVLEFDRAVDDAIANFIDYCRNHHVEEKTIKVAKKIQVAVANEGYQDEDENDDEDEDDDE